MNTLDKYKTIIDKIEEMCTSTVAMAPYSVGGISVTTIKAKQRKGKSHKPMLNYKYTKQWGDKTSDITETMNQIAYICQMIHEEVTEKDIEGARKRKLARLEKIGKGLKKNIARAESNYQQAEQNEQRASNILAPRANQIDKYLSKGLKAPKLVGDRFQRKYDAWKEARSNKENAWKERDQAYGKSIANLKTISQVKGVKN